MRGKALSLGGLLGGLLVAIAACGDDAAGGAAAAVTDDAGVPGDGAPARDGAVGDAGAATGRAPEILLEPTRISRDLGSILGITADDQVVYFAFLADDSISLKSAPLSGGAPVTIQSNFDLDTGGVSIRGAAVAFWTGLVDGIGTLNVWTKTTGPRLGLSTASAAGFFAATKDGSRIAFTTAATASATSLSSSDLVFADTATVTAATAGIFTANRLNLAATATSTTAAPPCPIHLQMQDAALVTSFCTGEDGTANAAQLYVVPQTTKQPFRVDTVGTASAMGLIDDFLANDDASRILAIGQLPSQPGRLILVGTDTASSSSVALDDNMTRAAAFIPGSGKVIYRTVDLGLRLANASATPDATTLVANAKELLDFTPALDRVLLRTKGSPGQATDIVTADTTTPAQTGHAIVKTQSAVFAAVTGTGERIVYVKGTSATAFELVSQPFAGGTELSLADMPDRFTVSQSTNGIVLALSPVDQNGLTFVSLSYVDAANAKSAGVIADQVDETTGYRSTDKTLVYMRFDPANGGLFRVALPGAETARAATPRPAEAAENMPSRARLEAIRQRVQVSGSASR